MDNEDFIDIYDGMLRSIGFSEINGSGGISKSVFWNNKFLAIFGKYFRILINIFGIGLKCVEEKVFLQRYI